LRFWIGLFSYALVAALTFGGILWACDREGKQDMESAALVAAIGWPLSIVSIIGYNLARRIWKVTK